MAIDSTIHANENTFKDAIKKMATKTDLAVLKTELRYMRWFIVIVVSIAVALIKYLP